MTPPPDVEPDPARTVVLRRWRLAAAAGAGVLLPPVLIVGLSATLPDAPAPRPPSTMVAGADRIGPAVNLARPDDRRAVHESLLGAAGPTVTTAAPSSATAAPASVALPTEAPRPLVSVAAGPILTPDPKTGIPRPALTAYHAGALRIAAERPQCGLSWWVLAGIGKVETGHAYGGRVDIAGRTVTPIFGPRLDGSIGGTAVIRDTDGGALDGDPAYDRAVGPMQFLPATWQAYGGDNSNDAVADPHNIYDAAYGAARYLCSGGARFSDAASRDAAILRYNNSRHYLASVLAWGLAYRDGNPPVLPAPPVPTQSTTKAVNPTPTSRPVTSVRSTTSRPARPTTSPPVTTSARPTTSRTTATTAPPTSATTPPTKPPAPTTEGLTDDSLTDESSEQ